jgi:hypothetical protein
MDDEAGFNGIYTCFKHFQNVRFLFKLLNLLIGVQTLIVFEYRGAHT